MPVIHSSFKTPFLKGTIIKKEKIAAHTYHLRVQGDDIKNMDYIPGQHMKVIVGMNKNALLNDKVRSYSIWDYNKENGTMDVAICTFSNGLGAKWAELVDAGDDFYFFIKTTLTVDDSAKNYFFIGDITTLAHFYKLRRSLEPDKKIHGFIYSDNETNFFTDLDGFKPFDFCTLQPENNSGKLYDNSSSVPVNFLKEKISSVFSGNRELSTSNCIVYLGGDARVCAAMTNLFIRDLQFSPEKIKMKSFWNPDKTNEG